MGLEDQIPVILNSLPSRISDVVEPWAERSPDHPALIEAAALGPTGNSVPQLQRPGLG